MSGEVFKVSDQLLNLIDKDIESMDEWLTNMSESELTAFHNICNKNPDERTDKEDYTICTYALSLYCRELQLDELAITTELMMELSGAFCANVILEPMRRAKMVETDGPLVLYKEFNIKLTDEGKDMIDKLKKDK